MSTSPALCVTFIRGLLFQKTTHRLPAPFISVGSHSWDLSQKKKSSNQLEMFLFCFVVSKQTTHLTNSIALFTLSLFPPPAIYLCKRTMQNKARLELADYEAVSTLSFWFSDCQEALSSMRSLCMDHNMMTLWISCFLSLCWKTKKELEQCPLGPRNAKIHSSQQKAIIKLQTFIQICKRSLCFFRSTILSEYNAVIYWPPKYMNKNIHNLAWHQQINTVSRGALLQCWCLAVIQ